MNDLSPVPGAAVKLNARNIATIAVIAVVVHVALGHVNAARQQAGA